MHSFGDGLEMEDYNQRKNESDTKANTLHFNINGFGAYLLDNSIYKSSFF